jgi:hypothetical protein
MAIGRRHFEHYAMRVTCVLLAALISWHILHGKGLVYAFYGFFLARAAIQGIDIASEQNWWISIVFVTVAGVASALVVYSLRDRPMEERWIPLLLTGCFFAQSMLLLSGRWRGVWSFSRARP